MKILVLGHKGMLGHMVVKYLTINNVLVETTECRWETDEFKKFIINSDCDFLINCIGAIPQKKLNWEIYKNVNIELPLFLSDTFKGNIIHTTTDSEFSGNLKLGKLYKKYDTKDSMDDYGISKSHASFILNYKNNVKQIRSSIIGPELNYKVSLMEWLFKQETNINGYVNHYWNGITTLEWSKQCFLLIKNWNNYDNVVQLGTNTISKFELLKLINKIYCLNKKISPIENTNFCNRCLESDFEILSLDEQLLNLKNFY